MKKFGFMKFKIIPCSYLKVLLDRLIRLKPAQERYERVFGDIINKFLINEHKKSFDENEKIDLAVKIFNNSTDSNFKDDDFLNKLFQKEENRMFFDNETSKKYLDCPLNLRGAFELIKNEQDLKPNLKWILEVLKNPDKDLKTLRKEKSILYPVQKILLCEGATEEILFKELSAVLGYDFKKEGVYVIGAGGKNQVARNYYKMVEEFRIPIFVLLDADAKATKELILPKLRPFDRIYVLKSGEFEDILPKKLIINALNERFKSSYHCCDDDFKECEKTAKELYEIYKAHGFGEFKKADFAKIIKAYMRKNPISALDLTDETARIVEKIKSL